MLSSSRRDNLQILQVFLVWVVSWVLSTLAVVMSNFNLVWLLETLFIFTVPQLSLWIIRCIKRRRRKRVKCTNHHFVFPFYLPSQILVAWIVFRLFQIAAYVVSIGLIQSHPTQLNTKIISRISGRLPIYKKK